MRLFVTPDQAQVVRCIARFIFCAAGRRWGKSISSDNRIVFKCLSTPGFLYCYITPTYAQLIDRFRSLAYNPGLYRFIKDVRLQPYPEIIFTNGSRCAFRTFERPNNLRGGKFHEVAVDEIQDIGEEYFWPVIRPLISDFRGNLICYGQFRGHNWYHKQLYLPGCDPKRFPVYKSFRFPSSTGLRFQGPLGVHELELAKQQIRKIVYLQEYECEPVANQSAVFDPFDLQKITRGTAVPQARLNPVTRRPYTYIMGLDLGRVHDPSAVDVLEVETGLIVHSETFPLGMKHELQAPHAAKIARRYGWDGRNARTIVDCTGGATGGQANADAYLQFYQKQIPDLKPFFWQRANKERIVQNLILEVEQGKISLPASFTELHDEMSSYEFEHKSGYYDYHAPTGKHDDHVAALAMACWARLNGWGPATSGSPIGTLI